MNGINVDNQTVLRNIYLEQIIGNLIFNAHKHFGKIF